MDSRYPMVAGFVGREPKPVGDTQLGPATVASSGWIAR